MSVASEKTWIAVSMPQPLRAMRAFAEFVIASRRRAASGARRREKRPRSPGNGAVDRNPLKSLDAKPRNSNETQQNPKKSKRRTKGIQGNPSQSKRIQENPNARPGESKPGLQAARIGLQAAAPPCPLLASAKLRAVVADSVELHSLKRDHARKRAA
jgi:hypothetical protein